MSAFYGNIKNNSRASFIFDRIYSTRKEMEDNMTADAIYNGRYVLVEYGEKLYEYNDEIKSETIQEDCDYEKNRLIDENSYLACYDSTVWQKIWTSTTSSELATEKYIMVAELNALAPLLNLIEDAPSDNADEQAPHFDMVRSTDLNYKFHVPINWLIDPLTSLEYNLAGFSKAKLSYSGNYNEVHWDNVASGKTYPEHSIIKDNHDNDIRIGKYLNNTLLKSIQDDTKKLNLDLSEIGDAISDLWDLIYPVGEMKVATGLTAELFAQGEYYRLENADRNYFVRVSSDCEVFNSSNTYYTFEKSTDKYTRVPKLLGFYTYNDTNKQYTSCLNTDIYNPNTTYYEIKETKILPYIDFSVLYLDNNNGKTYLQYILKDGDNLVVLDENSEYDTSKTYYATYIDLNSPVEATLDLNSDLYYILVNGLKVHTNTLEDKTYKSDVLYYILSSNEIALDEVHPTLDLTNDYYYTYDEDTKTFIYASGTTYYSSNTYYTFKYPATSPTDFGDALVQVESFYNFKDNDYYKKSSDSSHTIYTYCPKTTDIHDFEEDEYCYELTYSLVDSLPSLPILDLARNKYYIWNSETEEYDQVAQDAVYDKTISYYEYVGEGYRNTFIGNDRMPCDASYPKTLAELMRYIYKLLGLRTDNEFLNPSVPADYDTIFGLFNGLISLFGSYTDKISDKFFVPISATSLSNIKLSDALVSLNLFDDATGTKYALLPGGVELLVITTYDEDNLNYSADGYGTIASEEIYNNLNDNGYGPLYVIKENRLFVRADENGGYDANTLYYRNLNTLWALLREFQEQRDDYQSDWYLDLPISPVYICNRPSVVFAGQDEIDVYDINDPDLNTDEGLILQELHDKTSADSVLTRWNNYRVQTEDTYVLVDEYGDTIGVTELSTATIESLLNEGYNSI